MALQFNDANIQILIKILFLKLFSTAKLRKRTDILSSTMEERPIEANE